MLRGWWERFSAPARSFPANARLILTREIQISVALNDALLAGGPLPPRCRYRHFTVPKKDGSPRLIDEPGPDLKAVQREILRHILDKQKPHPAAVGFRRKYSTADHAWAHAGAAIIITADIKDFFPSTARHRVEAWWNTLDDYTDVQKKLLIELTTYLGSLPQGAPTSPALSNLVNVALDAALTRRTEASGGQYSRYGDDLVFSWRDGDWPPSDFETAVRACLREAGYTLNADKGWQVYDRRDEPQITGAVLTRRGQVDIPDAMKDHMRQLAWSRDPRARASLEGYENYAAMLRHEPLRNQFRR